MLTKYQKYKEYQQNYQKELVKQDPEYYLIATRDSQARLTELANAPKFRKYILELFEFAEAKQTEPELTYKKFKKRKYHEKWETKKKNSNASITK